MSPITSFKTFKQILKPCNTTTATNLSSSSTSSSSSLSSLSQEPTISRKPPKSSLSQQLQRLGQSFSPPSALQQSQSQNTKTEHTNGSRTLEKKTHVANFQDEEEEKEEREFQDFGRPKLGRFQFDHTGSFEPLVLSLPEELPFVQVIVYFYTLCSCRPFCLNCLYL